MLRALRDFKIVGVQTTVPFQIQLFQNRKFRAGRIHTHFVDQEFDFKNVKADHHEEAAILAAALEFLRREQMTPKYASPRPISPWNMAFRDIMGLRPSTYDFELDIQPDRDRLLPSATGRDGRRVRRREMVHSDRVPRRRRLDFGWDRRDGVYSLTSRGSSTRWWSATRSRRCSPSRRGRPYVGRRRRAPIPGLITKVLLKAGDAVKKDQPVLCLDAMKLGGEIASAGREGIRGQPGQAVEKGQPLFVIR
jgi:acetyl/propionyl-CoA carboxylase alpha subunit